jgi:hypothetical protein
VWLRRADVQVCSSLVGLNATLLADGEVGVPTNTIIVVAVAYRLSVKATFVLWFPTALIVHAQT